jgi:hypothetical protein
MILVHSTRHCQGTPAGAPRSDLTVIPCEFIDNHESNRIGQFALLPSLPACSNDLQLRGCVRRRLARRAGRPAGLGGLGAVAIRELRSAALRESVWPGGLRRRPHVRSGGGHRTESQTPQDGGTVVGGVDVQVLDAACSSALSAGTGRAGFLKPRPASAILPKRSRRSCPGGIMTSSPGRLRKTRAGGHSELCRPVLACRWPDAGACGSE